MALARSELVEPPRARPRVPRLDEAGQFHERFVQKLDVDDVVGLVPAATMASVALLATLPQARACLPAAALYGAAVSAAVLSQ